MEDRDESDEEWDEWVDAQYGGGSKGSVGKAPFGCASTAGCAWRTLVLLRQQVVLGWGPGRSQTSYWGPHPHNLISSFSDPLLCASPPGGRAALPAGGQMAKVWRVKLCMQGGEGCCWGSRHTRTLGRGTWGYVQKRCKKRQRRAKGKKKKGKKKQRNTKKRLK